jgi:SAM-dependent methyltransferase
MPAAGFLSAVRTFNQKLNDTLFPPAALRYTDRFRDLCCELGSKAGVVVHLGAGRVNLEPIFGGSSETALGSVIRPRLLTLDLSLKELQQNTGTLKVCGNAEALPFATRSVDLIVAQHVFEHFPRPVACLRECYRVLTEGGRLVVSGPNGRSYIALMARLTPLEFHNRVHTLMSGDRESNAFPTFYRFSSPRMMRRLAASAGLETVSIERFVGEPCYTSFLPLLHLGFIAYHLLLEKLKPIAGVHITSVAIFRKPA